MNGDARISGPFESSLEGMGKAMSAAATAVVFPILGVSSSYIGSYSLIDGHWFGDAFGHFERSVK